MFISKSYSPLVNKVVDRLHKNDGSSRKKRVDMLSRKKSAYISVKYSYSSYKIQDLTNINSKTIQKFFKRVPEKGNRK